MITLTIGMLLAGMLGVIYAPTNQAWPWIIVIGIGMGGILSLALSLLVLRTRLTQQATALSGMGAGQNKFVLAPHLR